MTYDYVIAGGGSAGCVQLSRRRRAATNAPTIMIAEKAADVIANGVAASPADGALAA